MPTLLKIDSSPIPNGSSFSRHLTGEFAANWQRNQPDGTIVNRDLAATRLEPLNAQWIAAAYTPESALQPEQRETLATSDELIAELQAADEYVIGVSMHNFSIPGSLKLWIDQIARAGKTFSYENGRPTGLLRGKKATFLVASGGVYEQGTPMASMNFVEPYLRAIFGFLGVSDITFISASGTSRLRQGVERGTILQPALESIQARFQAA